jgi:hypothetical protein
MKRWIVPLLLLFFVFAMLTPLAAQSEAERGVTLSTSLGGRLKPDGVSLSTKLYYTEPLYGDLDGVLWNSARLEMGLVNHLSPAYDDIALDLFFEPVAVFDIRVNLGIRHAYDLFGFGFTPVSSYDVDYSNAGSLESERRTGFFARLTPRLKLALGPFIMVDALNWQLYSFQFDAGSGGTNYFYEPSHDVILEDSDSILKNSLSFIYRLPVEGDASVLTGLTHEFLYVSGSGYNFHKLALLGALELPFEEQGLSLNAGVLLGGFLGNKYYSLADWDLSPALQVGITKEL